MVEKQQRQASEAQRQHDETLAKLRQEGAARMREAALSRHQLLQQVEALTTSNGSSDAALVIHTVSGDFTGWLSTPAGKPRSSWGILKRCREKSRKMYTTAINQAKQVKMKERRAS